MPDEIRRVARRRSAAAEQQGEHGQPPAAGATDGAERPRNGLDDRGPTNGHAAAHAPTAGNGRESVLRPGGGRIYIGTEGERTLKRGARAGDRAVRIVRPRLEGVHFEAPGHVVVEQEPAPRS